MAHSYFWPTVGLGHQLVEQVQHCALLNGSSVLIEFARAPFPHIVYFD